MHGGMAAQWGASQDSGGCHPTKGTSKGVFRTPPKGKDTPESGCGVKTLGQSRGVLCRDPSSPHPQALLLLLPPTLRTLWVPWVAGAELKVTLPLAASPRRPN